MNAITFVCFTRAETLRGMSEFLLRYKSPQHRGCGIIDAIVEHIYIAEKLVKFELEIGIKLLVLNVKLLINIKTISSIIL